MSAVGGGGASGGGARGGEGAAGAAGEPHAGDEASARGGRIVLVAYRPKPGHADALIALVKTHVPRLRAEGLVTARAPIAMQAADGTVVEVFEWASREAIARAHENPAVQAMWAEFAVVCDDVPVAAVPEAAALFSELTPI